MKYVLLPIIFFFLFDAQSQILGGTLVDEGRKLLTETDFSVEGTVSGYAVFELAVDRNGKVTAMTLEETDIASTPTKYIIRNYLTGFEFEGATNFPKYQHIRIKITSTK